MSGKILKTSFDGRYAELLVCNQVFKIGHVFRENGYVDIGIDGEIEFMEIEKSKDEEENDAENKNLKSNRTVKSLGFFIKCQTKSFTNLKSLKSKYKSKVKKKEFDYYSILREPIILFFVARDCEKIFFDIVDFRYRNSYNDFKNKINLRNLGDEKQQAWLYEVAKLYRFSVIEVVKNIHDTLENSLDTVEIDNMREFYTTELYNQANFYIAQCFPKLESDSLLKSAKHFNYGPLKYLSRRIESEFRFRLGNSVHGMR